MHEKEGQGEGLLGGAVPKYQSVSDFCVAVVGDQMDHQHQDVVEKGTEPLDIGLAGNIVLVDIKGSHQ